MNYFHIPGLNRIDIQRQYRPKNKINTIREIIYRQYINSNDVKHTFGRLSVKQLDQYARSKSQRNPLVRIRYTIFYFARKMNMQMTDVALAKMCEAKRSNVVHGISEYENFCETVKVNMDIHRNLCEIFKIKNVLKPI